jgi:hypothetical protein
MAYGQKGKRAAPFSLRLTFEERAQIEKNAGSMPVGAYIKSLLLADDAPKYRARRKTPVADHAALAQVLACLGATRIANNLNQLAHATHIGSFYFDEDTKRAIREACSDVHIMRQLLMQALGKFDPREERPSESTSQSFARATAPARTRPRL